MQGSFRQTTATPAPRTRYGRFNATSRTTNNTIELRTQTQSRNSRLFIYRYFRKTPVAKSKRFSY